MSRHILVSKETNKIINAIEVAPDGYTRTYFPHQDGSKYPTTVVNGEAVLCLKYLVPENIDIIETDLGQIDDVWPLEE